MKSFFDLNNFEWNIIEECFQSFTKYESLPQTTMEMLIDISDTKNISFLFGFSSRKKQFLIGMTNDKIGLKFKPNEYEKFLKETKRKNITLAFLHPKKFGKFTYIA